MKFNKKKIKILSNAPLIHLYILPHPPTKWQDSTYIQGQIKRSINRQYDAGNSTSSPTTTISSVTLMHIYHKSLYSVAISYLVVMFALEQFFQYLGRLLLCVCYFVCNKSFHSMIPCNLACQMEGGRELCCQNCFLKEFQKKKDEWKKKENHKWL